MQNDAPILATMNSAHAQQEYQVRLDWGMQGLRTIAPGADVVVIIDVLSFSTTVEIAVSHGLEVFPLDAAGTGEGADVLARSLAAAETHHAVLAGELGGDGITLSPTSVTADTAALVPDGRLLLPSPNGSMLANTLTDFRGLVVLAGLRNRNAVAHWIRARQAQKEGRFTVAIVAAGEIRDDASLRFALEDQFAAGALVDALADLGIDYHSPEAAAACASFVALRRALKQLIRASASGRELVERGFGGDVELAVQLDVSETVPVLEQHRFVAGNAASAPGV